MVRLSQRLSCIADMVTPGLVVADVGCDHAHLAMYLVEQEIAPFVYATDIHKGPLAGARKSIEEAGLSGKIQTVLCDGLTGIQAGAVSSIVMAGMGGPLMIEIMRSSEAVCRKARELILEPQSEPALLRHFLEDNGYRIISEDMVCEENKFYPVIKCIHGAMELSREVYYRYGKILIKERNPLLLEYLYNHRQVLKDIRERLASSEESDSVAARHLTIEEDLRYVEEAIAMMEEI